MASVPLKFRPPTERDIVQMKIFEAPTQNGVFDVIETVNAVGVYPTYIDHYTTDLAVSVDDWFQISWVDSKGAESNPSIPVQGGTETLVGEVVDRVMLRDPAVNENIAGQEAEAAIADYYHTVDPLQIPVTGISPQIISGLTSYTLARIYTTTLVSSGQANKWSAGIVSMDTSTTNSMKSADAIKRLLDAANRDLGRSYSMVMLLKETPVAGGFKRLVGVDLSRSIIEIQ